LSELAIILCLLQVCDDDLLHLEHGVCLFHFRNPSVDREGLIFLGLNAARYFNGLRMSGFTTFLGVISVLGGILDLVGMEGINGAVLLIVLGGYLILKPYFEKRQLFGKAEQG